jgi:flagellar hook-basal body protein
MNSSAYGLTARMMVEQNQKLQTITDNLANSATPGYRRDRVSAKAFDQLLMEKAGPPQISVDLSDGSLRNTGNPLDFAISGKGFFVLESDNGRQYLTRNGQFLLSGEGNLVTPAGLTVQSESGSINLPADTDMTKFSVDPDGSIRLDGRTMAKLLIVEPGNSALLKRVGPSLLTPVPSR